MYAKFQNEILKGCDFTGRQNFDFPADFQWPLQQSSATALPVITESNNVSSRHPVDAK